MADREELRGRRLFGGVRMALGDLATSPYRVDRDRVVASPFFARLAHVTQVVSPGGSGLLVHNRLTHSLKVAQVARAIAERLTADDRYRCLLDRLGGCDPDVVEAAALAHDLGHPPFGHLGERVLDRLARHRLGLADGFEGNAQSYRIVTSTEIRGETIGLDLTAAVRAALLKYPWARWGYPDPHPQDMSPTPRGAGVAPEDPSSGSAKFGAYVTELPDVRQAREPFVGLLADWQQTVEASIMDTADDIAYAIHDVEDFYRVGVLQQGTVAAEISGWQRNAKELGALPEADAEADAANVGACSPPPQTGSGFGSGCARPQSRRPGLSVEQLRRNLARKDHWVYDGEVFAASVEHVRQELVDGLLAGPFDGSVDAEQSVARFSARWTRRLVDAIEVRADPAIRSGHVLLSAPQWHEVQILKFIHHRFVLARPDLALHQRGQARLLATLVEALHAWLADPDETTRLPRRLHDLVEMGEAEYGSLATSRSSALLAVPGGSLAKVDVAAMARGRAIIDFVAALTDGQAVAMLDALSGRSGKLWTDAFVL